MASETQLLSDLAMATSRLERRMGTANLLLVEVRSAMVVLVWASLSVNVLLTSVIVARMMGWW